jgi:uncharacterized integral membrane protein
MKYLKWSVKFLLISVAVIAAYQNITPITGKTITLRLDLHVASWESAPIPLGFLIVGGFLAGLALTAVRFFVSELRLRGRVRRLEKELAVYRPAVSESFSSESGGSSEKPSEE